VSPEEVKSCNAAEPPNVVEVNVGTAGLDECEDPQRLATSAMVEQSLNPDSFSSGPPSLLILESWV
jgi:hypothetical protein